MKKQYEIAEMEILEFEVLDVITDSPLTLETEVDENWKDLN
jgi:hypothetical protein